MTPGPPRPARNDDAFVVEVPLAPGPSRVGSGRTPVAGWRAATQRGGVKKCADTRSPVGWTPDPWWRLRAALLRWLESMAKWIVLRGAHPDTIAVRKGETGRGRRGSGPVLSPAGEPDTLLITLGHGCPGPRIPVASSVVAAPDGTAGGRAGPAPAVLEACVVGNGAIAAVLVDRLIARGARVHATAETADDHAALAACGAMPVRFEELPAVAPRLGLLVSTSLACFVDARVVARLREGTAIVDVAPMPGSLDFEAAQRLGHEVVWLRCATRRGGGDVDAAWRAIEDTLAAAARDGRRSST